MILHFVLTTFVFVSHFCFVVSNFCSLLSVSNRTVVVVVRKLRETTTMLVVAVRVLLKILTKLKV